MNIISFFRQMDHYFGNLLVYLLSKLPKKKSDQIKKILVIRLWTLGESILTLPMIKKLNDAGYEIDILVTSRSKPVFESVSFINQIIDVSNVLDILKKIQKYDIAIDTEPYMNISSIMGKLLANKCIGYSGLFRDKLYDFKIKYNDKIHASVNFCNLISPLNINYVPDSLVPLEYGEKEKHKVMGLLDDLKIDSKKIIGIHCGTAETAPWRTLKNERFAEIITKLLDKNYVILLTGTSGEYSQNEKIVNLLDNKKNLHNIAGKLNLKEFSCLITKCSYFISPDTGPMHLAAAMGAKTVGLFGPNVPERFAPYGNKNISLYNAKTLECSPCINVHTGKFKECTQNGKCMDLISTEEILNEISE